MADIAPYSEPNTLNERIKLAHDAHMNSLHHHYQKSSVARVTSLCMCVCKFTINVTGNVSPDDAFALSIWPHKVLAPESLEDTEAFYRRYFPPVLLLLPFPPLPILLFPHRLLLHGPRWRQGVDELQLRLSLPVLCPAGNQAEARHGQPRPLPTRTSTSDRYGNITVVEALKMSDAKQYEVLAKVATAVLLTAI
eukprot:jgi/Chlat1/4141/Chrsp27S04255